jgi:hypothetical protein
MVNELPPRLRWLFGLFPFLGVIALGVAEGVQLATQGTAGWQENLVANSVTYLVGVVGISAGLGHMFWGPPIARSIGWGPSPFQWEVGGANLGLGIAGVMAGSFGRAYWLAVIVVAAGFLWVAGVGHIREIIRRRNLAISNAGPILLLDFLVPAYLLTIWLLWA